MFSEMVIDSFSYRYGFNYLHHYINKINVILFNDGEIAITDMCFVLSLPLRDMYLKEHPQIVVE